jgi:pimeloyl-[acyl-carrier protein] methyl ester esterase
MLVKKILLLPGMDGTGDLLLDFVRALPSEMHKKVPIYSRDRIWSYDDLVKLVESICEELQPDVILAESFSTPIAIRIAAGRPQNLKAVILCAGFAASPVGRLSRWPGRILAPVLMRVPLPASVIRFRLVGGDAPEALIEAVRNTISSVQPAVMTARLRAVLRCDVRSLLSEIDVPMLYLRAGQDRLIKQRSLQEIQSQKPDIRIATLEGPHFLLQREPEKAAEIVTGFLRDL